MPIRCLLLSVAVVLISMESNAQGSSQSDDANREVTVNYVYAAQLGIGGYEVGGLDVKVFTLPLAYTFDLDNPQGWRLKVKAPINLGLYEFNGTEEDGTAVSVDQQTLALIPGLELQVPVTDYWTLKPFGNLGIGRGLKLERRYAYLYSIGLNSLIELPWREYKFSIGNGVVYAGNETFDGDQKEDYSAIQTGLDVRRSLGFDIEGITPDLGVFVIHRYYPRPLEFQRFLQPALTVRNQLEVGFSIGSVSPFEMLWVTNPRIGASYITGDGLEVFQINFGFPF